MLNYSTWHLLNTSLGLFLLFALSLKFAQTLPFLKLLLFIEICLKERINRINFEVSRGKQLNELNYNQNVSLTVGVSDLLLLFNIHNAPNLEAPSADVHVYLRKNCF